jgi:ribonuclease P protein component
MAVAGVATQGAARLRSRERLLRRGDFQRCYREGRREHGVAAVLHAAPSVAEPEGVARLGITATRKVGGAVVRNRLRRWVREVFRQSAARPRLRGLELVVHLRPEAAALSFEVFRDDVEGLLARIAERWSAAPGRGR